MIGQIVRKLVGAGAFFIGLICVFITVAAITELITGSPPGKPKEPGVLIGLFFFGAGGTFGCYKLVRYAFSNESLAPAERPQKLTNEQWEGQILKFARREHGKLTIALMAAEFDQLDLEQSEKWLDTMVNKGVAQQEISPDGILYYVFPDFLEPTHD